MNHMNKTYLSFSFCIKVNSINTDTCKKPREKLSEEYRASIIVLQLVKPTFQVIADIWALVNQWLVESSKVSLTSKRVHEV